MARTRSTANVVSIGDGAAARERENARLDADIVAADARRWTPRGRPDRRRRGQREVGRLQVDVAALKAEVAHWKTCAQHWQAEATMLREHLAGEKAAVEQHVDAGRYMTGPNNQLNEKARGTRHRSQMPRSQIATAWAEIAPRSDDADANGPLRGEGQSTGGVGRSVGSGVT